MNTKRKTNVARGQPPASVACRLPSDLSRRRVHRSSLSEGGSGFAQGEALGRRRACRLASAFTLVELLVVISIIAILLGIILPSYFSIREKAKYTKAKVTVKNLETAFKAYLDHYRVWPAEFGGGADTPIDITVVNILRGDQNAANNKDGIPFYEFETTNSANGALDAWSNPNDNTTWRLYHVKVDNYDNNITAPDGSGRLYRTVIVWSYGADRTNSTSDDVKSWD